MEYLLLMEDRVQLSINLEIKPRLFLLLFLCEEIDTKIRRSRRANFDQE
jgi:hypothetical protein